MILKMKIKMNKKMIFNQIKIFNHVKKNRNKLIYMTINVNKKKNIKQHLEFKSTTKINQKIKKN